jgi:hypothetical protein
MRILAALGMSFWTIAGTCTPTVSTGIAVRPTPAMNGDSARNVAIGVAERVAARFAMRPTTLPAAKAANIRQCFWDGAVTLCTKVLHQEAQFYIVDGYREPLVDSLRRELLDSLRARFGEAQVRECKWEFPRDRGRSGCPPVVRPDSS